MKRIYLDGAKLKECRLRREWSQEELAAESRISRRQIQRIELGEVRWVTVPCFELLATALEATEDDLCKPKARVKSAASGNVDGEEDSVVELPGDLSEWTDEKQAEFLRKLAEQLKASGSITLRKKENGSVKLTIRMSAEDTERLFHAFERGELESLGVLNVTEAPATPTAHFGVVDAEIVKPQVKNGSDPQASTEDEPTIEPTGPPALPAEPARKRSRTRYVVVAIALLLLIVTGVVVWRFWPQSAPPQIVDPPDDSKPVPSDASKPIVVPASPSLLTNEMYVLLSSGGRGPAGASEKAGEKYEITFQIETTKPRAMLFQIDAIEINYLTTFKNDSNGMISCKSFPGQFGDMEGNELFVVILVDPEYEEIVKELPRMIKPEYREEMVNAANDPNRLTTIQNRIAETLDSTWNGRPEDILLLRYIEHSR